MVIPTNADYVGASSFNKKKKEETGDRPPMLDAAIPVLAVMDTASGLPPCFLRRAAIIARSRRDLPVPATVIILN